MVYFLLLSLPCNFKKAKTLLPIGDTKTLVKKLGVVYTPLTPVLGRQRQGESLSLRSAWSVEQVLEQRETQSLRK